MPEPTSEIHAGRPPARAPAPPRPKRRRSKAQGDASRANGARSAGPVSAEGKARSAMNALDHGLFAARYVVLPEESEQEFRELRDRCAVELGTRGRAEGGLAHTVATAIWREQRLDRLEQALSEAAVDPVALIGQLERLGRLLARNQALQLRARIELRRSRQERGAAADERTAALVEQRNTIEWAAEHETRRLQAAVAAARAAALEAARGGTPAAPAATARNEPENADSPAAAAGWAAGYGLPPVPASTPSPAARVIGKLLAGTAPVAARRPATGEARRP